MWLGTHTVCLSFSLQDTEIDLVDKMRLLGVSFDNSLTFNTHIKEIVQKAVLSIRAGSRPKQPATGQSLAGYFLLT